MQSPMNVRIVFEVYMCAVMVLNGARAIAPSGLLNGGLSAEAMRDPRKNIGLLANGD